MQVHTETPFIFSKSINQVAESTGEQVPEKPKGFTTLFADVKKAKLESNGTLQFLRKLGIILVSFLGGSVSTSVTLAIWFGFQIACIAVGTVYKDECPAEKYIPIYLIVLGAVFTIISLFSCCNAIRAYFRDGRPIDSNDRFISCISLIETIIVFFLFAWTIAGSVWVFRIYPPEYDDKNSELYCNRTVYLFSFGILLFGYCIIPALCACGCCVFICYGCASMCKICCCDDV